MQNTEPTPEETEKPDSEYELFFPIFITLGFVCSVIAAVASSMALLLIPLGLVVYFGVIGKNRRQKEAKKLSFRSDDSALLILKNGRPSRIIPYDEVTAIRVRRSSTGKIRYVAVRLENKDKWTVVSPREDEFPLKDLLSKKPSAEMTEIKESRVLDIIAGCLLAAAFVFILLYIIESKRDKQAWTLFLSGLSSVVTMFQCGGEDARNPNKRAYANGGWMNIIWLVLGAMYLLA